MSGYYLHQSSRLESFPERFPDIFLQEDPLSDPVYIVVQNSGLGEWLVRFLAENQGAVMGPRILMPEQALRNFVSGYPAARKLLFPGENGPGDILNRKDTSNRKDKSAPEAPEENSSENRSPRGLLFMDGMKMTVFKALEEVLQGKDSEDQIYRPLRRYVDSLTAGNSGSGIKNAADERLWQLADAIAGIFYHYGMNCLPLVEAWDRGASYFRRGADDDDLAAEAWQRGLWRKIFSDNAPYTHLSRVLSEVMATGESYDPGDFRPPAISRFSPPPPPPARIILFGSMFLGETGLSFFRYLSADFEVHHFILTPSKVFAFKREAGVSGELFVDPAGGPAAAAQPFLHNNGRLSAGFAALLPKLDALKAGSGGIAADENWENPGEGGALLGRLRASLIEDAPVKGPVEDDGSLAFHNVSGPRRAVEVVKDRILEALRDDETLAPSQIGVLAPDISRFAPYIETVFPNRESSGPEGSGHESPGHLNFNLADLPSRSEAPYPSALATLMKLPGSRFGRGTLIALFSNPCFAPFSSGKSGGRGREDEDLWRRIVETLHIRWGVDDEHRKEEGAADTRTGAWETAFERLLAGYYHDENDRDDLLPAALSGDGEADAAGDLMYVIKNLDKDLRTLHTQKYSLKDWTLKWEEIAEKWLSPATKDDEKDFLRFKAAIRDLMALNEDVNGLSDFPEDSIPWPAFSSLLDEFFSPAGRRQGRYLSRGVSCASLKPSRAIPFRRIYVLGLDEGVWPSLEFFTGFDLRDKVPKFIDLSRESVDRFALLETIFSAVDHLSLFYTGRDPERGEPLSPAAPLVELFEHLGEGVETLIRRHPLNPFHPSALSGEGELATSSPDALALGEILFRGLKKPAAPSLPIPPLEDEESIDWHTLVKFLKNPVEYFYLKRLETARDTGIEDLSEDDVLEAGYLEWWLWRNRQISENPRALLKPESLVSDFRRQLDLEGAVSDTPAGELQAENWREEASALESSLLTMIERGLDISDKVYSCRFVPGLPGGERAVPGSVVNLPAPEEGGNTITGILEGVRLLSSDDDGEIWTLMDFVSGQNLSAKHYLDSWAAALIIGAALKEAAPKEVRVYFLTPANQSGTLRRYFFKAAQLPGEDERVKGEEIRLLENPREILNSLLQTFREGESAPLPLYPDLADALAAAEKKGELEGKLPEVAAEKWGKIIFDTHKKFSEIRDCYYRRQYLDNPDFHSTAFQQAWENLYRDGGIL